VTVGQPLIRLDNADSKIALEQAEANLAQTVRQVRQLYGNNNVDAAEVAQRQTTLNQAQGDLRRRTEAARAGSVSREELAHAQNAVKAAQAALDAALQQLASNRSLTDNTSITSHPDVLAAAAKVRQAYLNAARDTIPAPVAGYIAQRTVQVGQRVAPGTPLMAVVPLNDVWVDANFKEGQLRYMRIGQTVKLTADTYGSSVVYRGTVAGLAAGTGSAFALLPAQNATGNWIKIVQRVPVRIALDAQELTQHPLRLGMSMNVTVNVHSGHRANQDMLLAPPPNIVNETNVFANYSQEAEAEIERIIAANSAAHLSNRSVSIQPRNSIPRKQASTVRTAVPTKTTL
jgi:membrane fusion protein (multidrug efflux system)